VADGNLGRIANMFFEDRNFAIEKDTIEKDVYKNALSTTLEGSINRIF
jgi:hypothetical protein